jgi:outer membrane protein OmpA-like peptidoglycan-associated protein
MLGSARRASEVLIRARTDFTASSARARAAAMRRGADAKRYLIRQGIPAAKIRLYYRSAGGFVENNTTATGRAKNRRVEIQFL